MSKLNKGFIGGVTAGLVATAAAGISYIGVPQLTTLGKIAPLVKRAKWIGRDIVSINEDSTTRMIVDDINRPTYGIPYTIVVTDSAGSSTHFDVNVHPDSTTYINIVPGQWYKIFPWRTITACSGMDWNSWYFHRSAVRRKFSALPRQREWPVLELI